MNSVNSADQGKGDKNALSFALIFIAITPTSLYRSSTGRYAL
jgi:hypothetical protein